MKILGIETSCDETAAAVVQDGRRLLSNEISSSVDLHKAYGGVVPEIAARSHLESILPVIEAALQNAFQPKAASRKSLAKNWGLGARNSRLFNPWDQIDAIAVTQGPGLIGSLLIGVLTARTLAIAKNKPLYAVNHVTAHPYAVFLTQTSLPGYRLPNAPPRFPLLGLTVSGGHTQLILLKSPAKLKLLGQSGDDAAGEAYDKVAKMLGLPYPGGPALAVLARRGNAKAFTFPKAKLKKTYDFSFSGLKTAVLRTAQNISGHDFTFPSYKLPEALNEAQKADIAASFQQTVNETLIEAIRRAENEFKPKTIVISGGVAANQDLRQRAKQVSTPTIFPDIKLCTDNAAMIAAAAYYLKIPADPYSLDPEPTLTH